MRIPEDLPLYNSCPGNNTMCQRDFDAGPWAMVDSGANCMVRGVQAC